MENETNKLLWWGYLHQFGTYHVKRYFNDPADLQEARESDFVSAVHGPFEAKDRQEALIILQKELK